MSYLAVLGWVEKINRYQRSSLFVNEAEEKNVLNFDDRCRWNPQQKPIAGNVSALWFFSHWQNLFNSTVVIFPTSKFYIINILKQASAGLVNHFTLLINTKV